MEDIPDSSAERLLVGNLDLVERLVRFVCRNKLDAAEAEEFSAWVKLRLVENHYAILRKFQGRCSLPTYLTIVIRRLFSDYQIHLHGKWHTSAAAEKLGPVAVQLERLLHRDRKPLDEAIAIVSTQDGAPSPSELEQLATELPARRPHPVRVSPDDVASQLAVSSDAESRVMAADRQQTANKVMRVLAKSLAALPPDDQALLRMRYAQDMTVAEIARMLQVEQKPLYRRIEAIKKDLRKQLINGGIKPEDVADIVGRNDTRLDFVLLLMGKPATRSSSNNGSGTGD